jgi:hypothetical protein
MSTSTVQYITDHSRGIIDTPTAQLNNKDAAQIVDNNTFAADSVHDELHDTIKKSSNHDDDIFEQTIYGNLSLNAQLNTLYVQDIEPGVNGNIPKKGQCESLIFDAGHASAIPGINNFLDSAKTPNLNEIIESMRLDDSDLASITYEALTGIGAKTSSPEELYKFILFKSKLNISDPVGAVPTSKNKLDYTAYSNYDIVIFICALKQLYNRITNAELIEILNKLFDDIDFPYAPMTDAQKLNRMHLISIVNINFLWLCTMRYIYQTLKDNHNQNDQDICLKLLNIRFIEMVVSKKSNIKEAKFQLGHTKPDPKFNHKDVNNNELKKPYDYITLPHERERYTNAFIYQLLVEYNFIPLLIPGVPAQLLIKETPLTNNTYLFYTSQSLCAKKILELKPFATVKDRSEDGVANLSKENDMTNGLNELFGLIDINTTNDKIFLYRILKFQGDTTHIVISHIINEGYKYILYTNNGKDENIMFNGTKYAIGTVIVKSPLIQILTGERPLLGRGVLEGVNIKAPNFKIFHNYYDPTIIKYIKHDANICSLISNNITTYKINLNNTINGFDVSKLDNTIQDLPNNIKACYNELIQLFNSKKILQEVGQEVIIQDQLKDPTVNYTLLTIQEYLDKLPIINTADCKNYITNKLFEKIKIEDDDSNKKLDIILFNQLCSHFYSLFGLFKEILIIDTIIDRGYVFDLDCLNQKNSGKKIQRLQILENIEKFTSFYNNFYNIFKNVGDNIDETDVNVIKKENLLINEPIQQFIDMGEPPKKLNIELSFYKKLYNYGISKINMIIDMFNPIIPDFYHNITDINIYTYDKRSELFKVPGITKNINLNKKIYNNVVLDDINTFETDFINRYFTPSSNGNSDKDFKVFIENVGLFINLLYNKNQIKITALKKQITDNNKLFKIIEQLIEIINNFTRIGDTFQNIFVNNTTLDKNTVINYIDLFKYSYTILKKLKNDIVSLNVSVRIDLKEKDKRTNPFDNLKFGDSTYPHDISTIFISAVGVGQHTFNEEMNLNNYNITDKHSIEQLIDLLIHVLNLYIDSSELTDATPFLEYKELKTTYTNKNLFSFLTFRDRAPAPALGLLHDKYYNTLKLFLLFHSKIFNIQYSVTEFNKSIRLIGYQIGEKERIYNYIICSVLNKQINTKEYKFLDLKYDVKNMILGREVSAAGGMSGGSIYKLKTLKKTSFKKMKTPFKKSFKKFRGAAVQSPNADETEINNILNLIKCYDEVLDKKKRKFDIMEFIGCLTDHGVDLNSIKDNTLVKRNLRTIYYLKDITNNITGQRILKDFVEYYKKKYVLQDVPKKSEPQESETQDELMHSQRIYQSIKYMTEDQLKNFIPKLMQLIEQNVKNPDLFSLDILLDIFGNIIYFIQIYHIINKNDEELKESFKKFMGNIKELTKILNQKNFPVNYIANSQDLVESIDETIIPLINDPNLIIKTLIDELNTKIYKDHVLSITINNIERYKTKKYLIDKTFMLIYDKLLIQQNINISHSITHYIDEFILSSLDLSNYRFNNKNKSGTIYEHIDNSVVDRIVSNATYYNIADIIKKILVSTKLIVFNDPIVTFQDETPILEDDLYSCYDYFMLNCSDELYLILINLLTENSKEGGGGRAAAER